MTEPGQRPTSDQLEDFERRLDKTLQERRGVQKPDTAEGSAAGLALRAVSELFVGLAVTMGLGWMADKWLGTAPWIMLAMMPLGLAAGVVNVMRLSHSKQADEVLGGKGKPAPSVKDDDED
ncbi:MAG: AtpZ/AtpI family protein [Rhizobiales bacterium]|nr:AtpZ/AtpI family protein [Hyphomicrobiales bacterium]MBI3673622.1 AtpZ/AtpI family protein [Hyphomicrobiales bacterium]